MSVDLFDCYDVRKRIGQKAFSRKRGSGKLFQPAANCATWKRESNRSHIAEPALSETKVADHGNRNRKGLKNKRISAKTEVVACHDSYCSSPETHDEESRVMRKLEAKMNRQTDKAIRRARGGRQIPRKCLKKPMSPKYGLEEDFSLPTVHEGYACEYEDDNYNTYNSHDYFYGDEVTAYQAESVANVEWEPENTLVSTCQTREEWQAELDNLARHVQWDATAEADDETWLSPDILFSVGEESLPISTRDEDELSCGCTTASVCLSEAGVDEFVVLDETALLEVLNAEAKETEDREAQALAEWELIDEMV